MTGLTIASCAVGIGYFEHRQVAEGRKGHNELCPFKEKQIDPDIVRWIEAQNPLPKHFKKEKERQGLSRQTKIDDFFVARKRCDKDGPK